jgi:hypothetical protein
MARQRIRLRRDTAATWTATNPILLAGEAGYETDTRRLKVGDGVAVWNALPYLDVGAGAQSLIDLADVDAQNRVDGSLLVYDLASAKFKADNITTRITLVDGGNF